MGTLYEKLKNYADSDYYGFHMPGHKRNERFAADVPGCRTDITEIEGFDDLHHAEGLLKKAQERASRLYNSGETHFLINGSTVGILSAVLGVTNKGDRILVARNCHKSVYHAIYMNELEPVYLYPEFDRESQLNMEISVEDVRKSLEEYPQIRAVVIVSPTYDGVVSDVAAIAEAAHEKGVPLIVDEAHGAHFGLLGNSRERGEDEIFTYFPKNSNQNGADIVIHSLHKTLPSLTQTALLHMNGVIAERERVRMYLHMLQSSSPSYVLMSSIDSCIHMLEEKKEELFLPYIIQLEKVREGLKHLKSLKLLPAHDRSKLIISTKNTCMSAIELYERLLVRYHLQMEMMAGTYVLAMTSVGDTPEGFERLLGALREIDEELWRKSCRSLEKEDYESTAPLLDGPLRLPRIYGVSELEHIAWSAAGTQPENTAAAFWQQTVHTSGVRMSVPLSESAGFISLEYVYLYPPGTPLVVPGELVTEKAARLLDGYVRSDYILEGTKQPGFLEVIENYKKNYS